MGDLSLNTRVASAVGRLPLKRSLQNPRCPKGYCGTRGRYPAHQRVLRSRAATRFDHEAYGCSAFDCNIRDDRVPPRLTLPSVAFSIGKAPASASKQKNAYASRASGKINFKICNDLAASRRLLLVELFLMQKLYDARHHRLDGNVLDFVFISGGIARRYAGLLTALHLRLRSFERADKV